MSLYKNISFQVCDGSITSSPHPQGRGVRQGCPLSPYLFIIVLTCIMSDAEKEYEFRFGMLPCPFSVLYPLWDIEYADDTVLLTNCGDTLEKLLHILQFHASRVGLELNTGKCQLMTLKSVRLLHFKTIGPEPCHTAPTAPTLPLPQ